MLSKELQTSLINWTILNSGHQEDRGYIGLSGIGDCERVIYERYMHGKQASLDDHLKTRISYELESKLIQRLSEMRLYSPGETIELYDGLVQGHTDGVLAGVDLLEIKTIPLEQWLPKDGRLPHRVFWQVQAYLHFTQRRYAHVVYLARDSGYAQVYGTRVSDRMGQKITEKLERLVEAVQEGRRPDCTCGRCR